MHLETIFLDAGGVLVFPNWVRIAAALRARGVQAEAAQLAAAEPRAKRRLDLGETIQSTTDNERGWLYFNLVLTEAGVPLSAATADALAEMRAYHSEQNLWETVPEDVPEALDEFRRCGLRLAVVSNANGRLRSMFERLGLSKRIDFIIDSWDEGVEKPNPRLFHIALERAGARAETTVHIGDLYHVDVAGARAAGLGAVLLDPYGLYEEYDCARVKKINDVLAIANSL